MKRRGKKIANFISVLNQGDSAGEPDQRAKETDDHPLGEKDPHDLVHLCSKGFHDADLTGLLHRSRNKRAHDSKRSDDHHENQNKEHRGTFDPNRIKELAILVDPRDRLEWWLKNPVEAVSHLVSRVRVSAPNGDSMHAPSQAVGFLHDVQRYEYIVGVVGVPAGVKHPRNSDLHRKNELPHPLQVLFIICLALGIIESLLELSHVVRRIDFQRITYVNAKRGRQLRTYDAVISTQIKFSGDQELLQIRNRLLQIRIDSAQPRNGSMVLELNDDATLSKRSSCDYSLGFLGVIQDLAPVIHDFVAAYQYIGIEPDDLPLELPFKTSHHRDHNNQYADPKDHAQDRDQCNQRNKGALRLQVAQRQEIRKG